LFEKKEVRGPGAAGPAEEGMVCAEVVKVSCGCCPKSREQFGIHVEGQRGACDVNQEFDVSEEDES
jgi:hypothetical protein